MVPVLIALSSLLSSLGGCVDLPVLRQGACGNSVVEPGEDCDSFAPEGQECGRSGSPVACRFVCSQTPQAESPDCPTGWLCGTDDICRLSSGTFRQFGPGIDGAVRRVLLGNFQGNGRASVLGLSSANQSGFAYGRLFGVDEKGVAQELPLFGFPIGSAAIADLSGDGRDDMLFHSLGGIGVLLGQESPGLAPVTYPIVTLSAGARTRAVPFRPYPGSPLDEGMVIFNGFGQETSIAPLEDGSADLATLAYPLESLVGEPVTADIISGPDSPCGELLFAFRGTTSVWMAELCDALGWASGSDVARTVASLPSGRTITSAVHVDDINNDGLLDVLVGADGGDSFVAFGCGDGLFCGVPDDHGPASEGKLLPLRPSFGAKCDPGVVVVPENILALGDLNNDGVPDVVTPRDILLTQSITPGTAGVDVEICVAASRLVGTWSLARIADLNQDGMADLIAGSSEGLDLDFFAGTGMNRLNLTKLSTQAPVSHLAVGDFDGDRVPDVAVGLIRAGIGPTDDAEPTDVVAIAYGRVSRPPESLTNVASFPAIDQILSAHFETSDAVQELGVVAMRPDDVQTVTVFLSGGSRELLAPFGLQGAPAGPNPITDVTGTSLRAEVGFFTNDSYLDIAAFAIDGDICTKLDCATRLWLIPSSGEAQLSEPSFSAVLPSSVMPFALPGGLGTAELALFLRGVKQADGAPDALFLISMEQATERRAGIWRVSLPEGGQFWADISNPLDLVSDGPLQLVAESYPVVRDVDGDGALDVLMIAQRPEGRRVVIAWGKDGVLDLSAPEPIEIPAGESSGFAMLQADADPLLELVIVGPEGAYLAQRAPGAPRAWAVTQLDDVGGGTSVAALDIDGNGLEDLAIADEAGVRLYRGASAQP